MHLLLINSKILLFLWSSFGLLYFTFLLLQKSNKKRAPKTITARFREGALIKLLYYCAFNSSSLKANLKNSFNSQHISYYFLFPYQHA